MTSLDTAPVRSRPDKNVSAASQESLVQSASPSTLLAARSSKAIQLSAIGAGIGIALIVGLDGTPPWRAVRLLVTALVVFAVVSGTRRWAGKKAALAALTLAIVTIPVGATVGFSYLGTTGVSARAVGGVMAAAGGVALLVVSVAALLRPVRRWRRLVALPIAMLIISAVWYPVINVVYATNVPRPNLGSETPGDRGLRYQNATFVTTDGVRLSGWYVPSRNGAAVVLMHGASSTRTSVLDEAVVLARHGYGVLLFDARGHGRSSGRAMDFGWYGDRDVSAAVTYVQRRPHVDTGRIGAVGMSMGGEEAIGAMAGDPRIRAAVAEGATNRVFGDKAWLSARYGVRGSITKGVEWLTYRLTDLLTAAKPPITLADAVARSAPRPVLLITAGNVSDETNAGNAIRAASPRRVEVWNVPGANHTGGLRTQPIEWRHRVSRFLDRTLLPVQR